jgi:hypothetical protein
MGVYVWTNTWHWHSKNMAGTGVFVRVVCALERFLESFSSISSTILTLIKHKQSHSHQKVGPEKNIWEGRQRTKQTERQPRTVVDFLKLNT